MRPLTSIAGRVSAVPLWIGTSDNSSYFPLPACQAILNAIGNLLAYGCQLEKFLFAEDIFVFFGDCR
jgi:hypothetical protein